MLITTPCLMLEDITTLITKWLLLLVLSFIVKIHPQIIIISCSFILLSLTSRRNVSCPVKYSLQLISCHSFTIHGQNQGPSLPGPYLRSQWTCNTNPRWSYLITLSVHWLFIFWLIRKVYHGYPWDQIRKQKSLMTNPNFITNFSF